MEDPIVEEVRKARQDHAKKFNHDLSEICKDLKKIEKKYEQRTVSLPPKLLKTSNRPRSSAVEA
jgi:ABC-type Zn uptake system ZnuABC Zn-binding protein ZnuA